MVCEPKRWNVNLLGTDLAKASGNPKGLTVKQSQTRKGLALTTG